MAAWQELFVKLAERAINEALGEKKEEIIEQAKKAFAIAYTIDERLERIEQMQSQLLYKINLQSNDGRPSLSEQILLGENLITDQPQNAPLDTLLTKDEIQEFLRHNNTVIEHDDGSNSIGTDRAIIARINGSGDNGDASRR